MSASDTLGVDIGGVIIDRVREDAERGVAPSDYATVRPMPGALPALARLVKERFGERVWLVSRCDEDAEPKILDWLRRHDFFATTGVARERVRFCRGRADKAPICESLGVTHFVDDRLEVLSHLVGKVPHLYWLPSRAEDADRFRTTLPHVRRVDGWNDVVGALLA